MLRFYIRSKVSESHNGLPRPGVSHWEDKSPESLALKVSDTYFQESQRTMGNRSSTLKGHTQNLTHTGT